MRAFCEKTGVKLRYRILALLTFFFMASFSSAGPAAFSMKSTSFSDHQEMPVLYTCDGKDLSPQLAWSSAPSKTKSYVLIFEDPDAPGGIWYHWVVYNIPSSVKEVPAGAGVAAGAMLGENSWGRIQYNGPCPPRSSTHHYQFTVYALDSSLDLPDGADAKTILKAIQGHVLGQASLRTIFGH